ncbi:hypothetical protein Lesp02_29480 [Lentzea sp. NBRC 105346]|nr:hypothetical protein Lesp02_29480 [Lentzea sp. NBRC 105346]
MEIFTTSRALGHLMSGGLCVPAGSAAQRDKSALIQVRDRAQAQSVLVPITTDVPNNYTSVLSAHHVRRT